MAYMDARKKKEIAPAVKHVLSKWGQKGTLSVQNHMTLCVKVKKSDILPEARTVNHYWIDQNYSGDAAAFLLELKSAMNTGNHDRSDIMTDYFDVGWYIHIEIVQ